MARGRRSSRDSGGKAVGELCSPSLGKHVGQKRKRPVPVSTAVLPRGRRCEQWPLVTSQRPSLTAEGAFSVGRSQVFKKSVRGDDPRGLASWRKEECGVDKGSLWRRSVNDGSCPFSFLGSFTQAKVGISFSPEKGRNTDTH